MVTTKILGYFAAFVGVASLVFWSFEDLRKQVPILPEEFTSTYLLIGGGILILVGIMLLKMSGGRGRASKQAPEVPIFQGKNIVGYRRHGK